MDTKQYLCIDQKSFYATVECVARGLDPMTTDLVVADSERSENTICLAVSPSLKAKGVSNRCRVKEIPKHIKYITAVPRMQMYIDCAAEIHGVFLKYIAPEDIHTYSIDESFLDVTPYLNLYKMTARELAKTIIDDVRETVGTVSTCGIGTNLYLAKIALDLHAKHAADFIAELDENSYREKLWDHKPITDFWQIASGKAERLRNHGITTMRDIAMMKEDYLYDWFGIDAELLIDHAWGREPTTIADIKAYRSKSKSLSSGQVLMRDYRYDEGLVIANALVALAGAVMAQKNRVFEISMGTGSMVFGLAAVIIGVNIFKNRQKVNSSTAAIVGSIIYKACVAFALSMGLMPQDLKLITAVLFLLILVLSGMKKKKVKFNA